VATHVALVRKEPSSDGGASFPGCVTAGATPDEAMALAHGVLAFHLKSMAADGDLRPARPRTVAAMPADFELAGGPPSWSRSSRRTVLPMPGMVDGSRRTWRRPKKTQLVLKCRS
jgi:hypothetical protein